MGTVQLERPRPGAAALEPGRLVLSRTRQRQGDEDGSEKDLLQWGISRGVRMEERCSESQLGGCQQGLEEVARGVDRLIGIQRFQLGFKRFGTGLPVHEAREHGGKREMR